MADILFISPIPTHPTLHGNRARTLAIVEALQQEGHRIHFIYGVREPVSEQDQEEMHMLFTSFSCMYPDQPKRFESKPKIYELDEWWINSVEKKVDFYINHYSIDLVIVNYVWFSKALSFVPRSIPTLIDTHDLFADRHVGLKKLGLEPSFFYTSKKQEDKGFARATHLIAIQDEEAEIIKGRGFANCSVIGHLIKPKFSADAKKVTPDKEADIGGAIKGGDVRDKARKRLRIGYFGSDNQLNQLAAQELSDCLLKKREAAQKVDWILAGSICRFFEDNKWPGIKMNRVDHPADFYRQVDLVVNPHIGGTGLKIKSVEALAFGKALLGTKDAMLGLNSPHSFHCLTGSDQIIDTALQADENRNLFESITIKCQDLFDQYSSAQFLSLRNIITTLLETKMPSSSFERKGDSRVS